MQPASFSVQPAVWRFFQTDTILPPMLTNITRLLLTSALLLPLAMPFQTASAPASGPEYTSDAQLKLPENYREWVYLTSGFDMSYNPAGSADHHMFDNVFVNPEAYRSFLQTATW